MALVNMQFVMTVTKTVEMEDSDEAEEKMTDLITKQLEKLGFEVEVDDVGIVDEEGDDEDDEDDDDDDEDEEDEDEEDE